MKRSPIKRTTRLSPGEKGLKRGPIAKQNKARVAKRQAAYRRKLAKSRKSQGYAEAMERAGGRCEYEVKAESWCGRFTAVARCDETKKLHAHHKTYARLGGDELASDFLILCRTHHELVESQHSHRRHGRTAA